MHVKPVFATLALTSLVAAKTVEVKVGEGGKKFSPSDIKAEAGDEVVFKFVAGGHDVSESSFDKPCQPKSGGGIWSGQLNDGSFTVKVENTDPIWLYCSQGNHCKKGMTAAINAPSSGDTLEAYTKAAGSASASTPSEVSGGNATTADGEPKEEDEPNAASSLLAQGAATFSFVAACATLFGLL